MAYLIQAAPPQVYFDAISAGMTYASGALYLDGTNGNDANPPGQIGAPWKTLDRAMDFILRARLPLVKTYWSLGIANGSYTWSLKQFLAPDVTGLSAIALYSLSANAANVQINMAAAPRFAGACQWQFDNLAFNWPVITNGDWHSFRAYNGVTVTMNNCVYNLPAGLHDLFKAEQSNGAFINIGNPTLNFYPGETIRSLFYIDLSTFYLGGTVRINNPPNMNVATIFMDDHSYGYVDPGINFVITGTGTLTGQRYSVNEGSVLLVGGASTTALPGTVAGTVDAVSIYGASQ